jgi:uncharacterized protein YndB with AHSA1/START domain
MSDLEGVLRLDGDRRAVRFERAYAAGPAELWSALTEPDRVRRWLGAEVTGGRIEPGGEFTFRWSPDDDEQTARCRVLTFDPPRTFELSWGFTGEPDSVVRIELAAAPAGGTLLTLDHRLMPTNQASGYGAGWHAYLDALGDDALPPWDDRFMALWPQYKEAAAALG